MIEICHFWVASRLCFKVRLSAKVLVWKRFFYSHANKTHFHEKGFALSLVLKVRVFGTWKWHIGLFFSNVDCTNPRTCKLPDVTFSSSDDPLLSKMCHSSVPPGACATGCTLLLSEVTPACTASSWSNTEWVEPRSMSARPNDPDASMNTWRLKTSAREERTFDWNKTI